MTHGKKLLFIAILCSTAFAAEFSASVNRTELALNQSLVLKLKLLDTVAKSTPDFSKLKNIFNIVTTSQYSSVKIINAKSSIVTEWNLTLNAKQEGNITIPAITVDTSIGKLSTKELTVKIAPAEPLSSIDKNSGIFVKSSVDNKKPYKFEPFIYTIKLHTAHDVKNVVFSPLELADVSVKPNGSYNIYSEKYQGEWVNVIELSYIITPLKSGQITIPGIKITGVYTTRHDMAIASLLDSVFKSDQHSITATNSEEFVIESEESRIEVLPPPAVNITPWLPAKSISLREDMNESDLMVGKPITRTITITANGLCGNQLPSIASEIDSEDYKIYAETPEITNNIEQTIITSARKETYIIIPQKSGKIMLPSIEIKWWNVKKSKLEYTILPSKTLHIMPDVIIDNVSAPKIQDTSLDVSQQKIITEPDNFSLYFLLALLIFGSLFIIYTLTKSPPNLNWLSKFIISPNKVKNFTELSVRLKDLNYASSVKDLNEFLKYYARCNLNLPQNSSLGTIFSTLKDNSPNIKEEDYKQLLGRLEGALYANQDCSIVEIRQECLKFLKLANKSKKEKVKKEKSKLPKLNPVY